MKKFVLGLAVVFAMGMVACGGDKKAEEGQCDTNTQETVDPAATPDTDPNNIEEVTPQEPAAEESTAEPAQDNNAAAAKETTKKESKSSKNNTVKDAAKEVREEAKEAVKEVVKSKRDPRPTDAKDAKATDAPAFEQPPEEKK